MSNSPSPTAGGGLASAAGLLAPLLMSVDPAMAEGNPLLTGKTVSLIHPAIMLFLFGSTAWTAWLGWQWRCALILRPDFCVKQHPVSTLGNTY